jgi:hypothetical protein
MTASTIAIAAIIKPHGVELFDVVTGTVVVVVGRVVDGTVVVVGGVVVVVVVEVVVVVVVEVVVVEVVVVVVVGSALPVPPSPNATTMALRTATSADATQRRKGTMCDVGFVPRSALILAFLLRSKVDVHEPRQLVGPSSTRSRPRWPSRMWSEPDNAQFVRKLYAGNGRKGTIQSEDRF